MSSAPQESQGTEKAAQREHLRHRVHRYLNLPVALAAILFVLVAFTHISGTGTVPWRRHFWHGPSIILLWLIWAFFIAEFGAKLALSPHKPSYLRRHWFDAVVALLPVAGVLRLIDALLISPLVRLVRGEKPHPHLAILAKRKLDKLALISILVILIVACLAYIFENGARGATINTFGDALWWAAATATTVGNQLYPVTIAGEILAFSLMLFAIGVFSYLTSSIASALIGGDAAESDDQSDQSDASTQAGQASAATQAGQASAATQAQAAQAGHDTQATPAQAGRDTQATPAQAGHDTQATPAPATTVGGGAAAQAVKAGAGAGPGGQQSGEGTAVDAGTRRHNGRISVPLSPDELETLRTILERVQQTLS